MCKIIQRTKCRKKAKGYALIDYKGAIHHLSWTTKRNHVYICRHWNCDKLLYVKYKNKYAHLGIKGKNNELQNCCLKL